MRPHTLATLSAFVLSIFFSAAAFAQDDGDNSEPPGPSVEELKEKKDFDDKPRKLIRLYFDQKYPEGEAAEKIAGDAIDGTEIVMHRAESIAQRQGQSVKGLRNMHVYQLAAKKALEAGETPVAVYLSLRARGYARDLILANNEQFPEELEGTDAERAKRAGGVTDKETERFVKGADAEVGTAEEILSADED